MTSRRARLEATGLSALAALLALLALAPATHAQRRRPRRPARPAPSAPAATPAAAAAPSAQEPPVPDELPPPPSAPPPPVLGPTPPPVVRTVPSTDTDDAPLRRPGREVFDAFVSFAPFARLYSYHDDIYNRLRPYTLPFAPAVAARVAWYPGAHATTGPGSWFGLVVDGSYAPLLRSRDGSGTRYPTTAYAFSAGLHVRLPLGPVRLGLLASFGQQVFRVEPAGSTQPGLPATEYTYVRTGLDLRARLGPRFALLASGGFVIVLDAGSVLSDAFFPRGSVFAADASVGFAVPLAAGFEARLELDARRYFFAFDPEPGDRNVAGGALDHYFTGRVGFAFRR